MQNIEQLGVFIKSKNKKTPKLNLNKKNPKPTNQSKKPKTKRNPNQGQKMKKNKKQMCTSATSVLWRPKATYQLPNSSGFHLRDAVATQQRGRRGRAEPILGEAEPRASCHGPQNGGHHLTLPHQKLGRDAPLFHLPPSQVIPI